MIRHGSGQLIPMWLGLNEVVATGRPVAAVNQQSDGTEFFQQFVNDIFPLSYPAAQALARYLDCNVEGRMMRGARPRRWLRSLGALPRPSVPMPST